MEKLFITRDGVPIYPGDTFYYITVSNTSCYSHAGYHDWKKHECGYNFSTEKLCEEYIENRNIKRRKEKEPRKIKLLLL
jgi:hypothetical protein